MTALNQKVITSSVCVESKYDESFLKQIWWDPKTNFGLQTDLSYTEGVKMFGAVQCMWDDVLNVEVKQKQMKSLVKTYICNVIKNIIINIKHCKLVSYFQ